MKIFVKCILLILVFGLSAFAQEVNEPKPEPKNTQVTTSAEGDRGHYVILGYDLATRGVFKDGYTSKDLNDEFDTTIEFESGFSVGYEYRKAPMNAWGSAFGIIHTFQRDVESMTVDGKKTKANSDVANVSMTSVYANLIYRWETFYIPFGLVFSRITYNPPDAFEGDLDSKGGLGFNFALGWKLNENFLLEYGARSSIWDFDYNIEVGDDDVHVDMGTGTLSVATLALKYKF